MKLMLDADAWQAGYDAGKAGKAGCPYRPGTPESLAWQSGYIEGKAAGVAHTR